MYLINRDISEYEKLIEASMNALGVPSHLLGYGYIRQAAVAILLNSNSKLTTEIYPMIANENHSSPVMVNRAIRHAIEVMWRNGSIARQRAYFCYCSKDNDGIPTNSEVVHVIADRVAVMTNSFYTDSIYTSYDLIPLTQHG